MLEDGGEGEERFGREEDVADLRAAGTLRLMFSSASRRSAWKSGWRKVQLCKRARQRERSLCARERARTRRTYVLAELVVVGIFHLWRVVSVCGVKDV